MSNLRTAEKNFAKDLRECVEDLKRDKSLNHSSDSAMYGAVSSIPDKRIIDKFLIIYLEELLNVQK